MDDNIICDALTELKATQRKGAIISQIFQVRFRGVTSFPGHREIVVETEAAMSPLFLYYPTVFWNVE